MYNDHSITMAQCLSPPIVSHHLKVASNRDHLLESGWSKSTLTFGYNMSTEWESLKGNKWSQPVGRFLHYRLMFDLEVDSIPFYGR